MKHQKSRLFKYEGYRFDDDEKCPYNIEQLKNKIKDLEEENNKLINIIEHITKQVNIQNEILKKL